MRRYKSQHNLNENLQSSNQMHQHILLPKLNSQKLQQINVYHLLSSENSNNKASLPQVAKLQKTKSLSQLSESIQKVKVQNQKIRAKFTEIKRQKKGLKIKTQPQQGNPFINKLRKKLQNGKERHFFHKPTQSNQGFDLNKRWHSEQRVLQKCTQILSKGKGFSKCKAQSVFQLQKMVEQQHNSSVYKAYQKQHAERPNNQLKLNIRKQITLLKIPDNKKPLKLSKPQQFKKAIPKQGYQYILSPFDKYNQNQLNQDDEVKVQTTVSKYGVMVKEFDQTKFYTNLQYQEYLKKIEKISNVQFFRNFLQIKCFKRWKIFVFSQRFLLIRGIILQQIPNLYPNQLLEIRKIFDRITNYKYILLSRESPLQYEKYLMFLHESSYPVLKRITQQHYMQVIELTLGPIKQKVMAMQALSQKHQKLIQKHKKPYKLSKLANFLHITSCLAEQAQTSDMVVSNFQKTFQFKNQFLYIEGFIKRIFYNFTTYHIEWTGNIYNQIITKIRTPLINYKKVRDKIHGNLNNLFNLKNKEQYRYQKTDSYEMQIRLIEYVCRFNQGGENMNNEIINTNQQHPKRLFITLTQVSILSLFEQFATHLISRLSPGNLLTYYKNHFVGQYRMGKSESILPAQQQLQMEILQMVMQKIDVYTASNIINSKQQMKYDQKFRSELLQIITQNIQQANEIVDILNTLINDVMQFFHSQNRKQSYILSYTIMEETRQKIALIPDDIQVGLFVINILQVKSYLRQFINRQLQELTKDLPEQFKNTYNAFYKKLFNYSTKINLSVWTIQDFVTSFQYKEMYEQYREDQTYKDQQKIKNILSAVSKTLPKTYQQCYVLFLKLKDMIQKIQTKVQTFDLNCIKKLKFFANQIEQLAQNIWRQLVKVRNRILQVDNYVERQNFIQDILLQLPKFQTDLKTIKKSIQRLSYIETLQIRFNLKQKLTKDFNLYEKSQSDLKLLQSLLKKLLIFQKSYNGQLQQSITVINAQSLLEEINTNKSQIKISQKYIVSYQKILFKIYDLYDYYKIVLQTADELGRLQKDEIHEILRFVMIDNQNKQEGKPKQQRTSKDNAFQIKQKQSASSISSNFVCSSSLYYMLNSLSLYSKKDNILTLQQTINLQLYKKYDQIHYEILKKEKKKKMDVIIKNIQTNMNDIILEVCNLEKSMFGTSTDDNLLSSTMMMNSSRFSSKNNFSEQKKKKSPSSTNRTNSILAQQMSQQIAFNQARQKHQINLHSGFVNLKQSIKVIEEILNELKNIILSPFLQDQKNLLLQKIQYVASNLDILNLLYSAQTKVQRLIEDNILTDAMKQIQKDWSSHHSMFENRLGKAAKEISFDNKLQKDVINAWYLLLRRLSNKKVSQISLCFKEQSNDLQNFMGRLNSFEKIVNIKIQQKKTIFPLLYFFTNSEILKFVLNPQLFVSHMFPCLRFERRDKKKFALTTIYGQQIEIQLNHQPTLTIKSIYQQIKNYICEQFKQNIGQHPIDQVSLYIKQKTPLQIIYVLDQLYIQEKYIIGISIVTSPNIRQQTISNLMGQIKILSKMMTDPVQIDVFDYKNMFSEMMICSRIDYRHRIETNFIQNYWIQELLVYYIDSYNTLYLKNLNHLLEIKFFLVNAMNMISLFPGSQKTFVKMCEAFSGQLSAIQVRQTDILKTLSAKLMYPFIEHQFFNKIPDDVCRGIVWNYPVCFLAKCEEISYDLLSKLIRCIEKVRNQLLKQRQQKGLSQSCHTQNAFFTNSTDSACIFLCLQKSLQAQVIPHKLKAMFRSLTRITPCYEVVFLSKLLRADLDSTSSEIQDSLYIVNGYFYLYREILGHNPIFSFVNKLLSKLAKQLINKKDSQYRETIQQYFVQYFVNLGLQKNSIQNFLPRTKSQEVSKFGSNMRETRMSKNLNKKIQFIFKFLIDVPKKQTQLISALSNPSYQQSSTKPFISTYQLKQKIDTFIQGVKDSSHGCIPDLLLSVLEEIIKIVVGSINEPKKVKPIFIFGQYRSGKTLLIKLLSKFFYKIFYKEDAIIEIAHQLEIPKNFTRIKDQNKRIAMLKMYLQKNIAQKSKTAFIFLQISSCSNQNGFLETFLNIFDDQTSNKYIRKQHKMSQKLKKAETSYILQIKKMVTISPNIFLNTYKFYLPDKMALVEQIQKKWSKDFLHKYEIKQKDDNYYLVVNSHHVAFKMITSIFDNACVGSYSGSNGIDWLLQPVLQNFVTSVLKMMDAFLIDIHSIDVLYKNMDTQRGQKSIKSIPVQQSATMILQPNQPQKQKQQQFLKMIAYCTFWTLSFFSEQNSYQIIEKIVKQHYYRINSQTVKTKDNFLYKILLIENNHISYNFLKCLNSDYDNEDEINFRYGGAHESLIIENLNMKVFNFFASKFQVLGFQNKIGNNILVIGREQAGKSAYLKNYFSNCNDNMYIRLKSFDIHVMSKLIKQLTDFKFKKPRVTHIPGQQAQSIFPKRSIVNSTIQQNILIWVQNVAFYQQSSQIQKYMKFLSQHKQYRAKNSQNDSVFVTKQLKNIMYYTQRRYAQKQYLYENWNLTVMGISFLQQQMQSIFMMVIGYKLNSYIFDENVIDQLKGKLPIMVNHHLTLLKFCRQNTKPSLSNWTINIGYGKYRYVTQQFFCQRKYSFLAAINAQEIIKRLNLNLFFTLFCCMRNKKDLELFQNRVTKFLDLDYKEVQGYLMDDQGQLNNKTKLNTKIQINDPNFYDDADDPNNSLARLSLKLKQNRFFKNILIHPTFCRNFQIVSYTLKNKKHIMINKKFISRDFSLIQMILQTQGKDWGKLDLVQSFQELKQSVSKLTENVAISQNIDDTKDVKGKKIDQSKMNQHSKKEFYLYVPYQIIKLNPLILEHIVEYIEQKKSICEEQKQIYTTNQTTSTSRNRKGQKQYVVDLYPIHSNSSPSVIFIIQYSLFELTLINNYLLTGLPKICTVLRLTTPSLVEYQDVGFDILCKKFPQQQMQGLKQISKTLHTVFTQIFNMPLADISYEKTKFIQQYNFNVRNYGQFVRIVGQVYYQRLRFAQLKKNSLELTLSEIDKLVRQYKTLKKDQNVCMTSKKGILVNIQTVSVWLKSAKKKVDYMRIYSVQQGIFKYKQNIQSIIEQIIKMEQNQRKLARMSKHLISLISRNQLAQLKYIFVNNFVSMRPLFECICLVLGDGLDFGSMKKCFTDLNLVNRLKEVELQKVKYQTVLQIKGKITQMLGQNKSFSTIGNKTVFQWLRCSVDLLITRNQMQTRLPTLQKQKQDLQTQLNRLIQTNQINSLQQQIQQKQQQLIKNKQTLKEIQDKLRGVNQLLLELDRFDQFFQLKRHCQDQNKSLQQIVKDFLYYAILQGVELVFFNIFSQTQKKRIRTNFGNFMKRKFGFISNKQKQQVFEKFEEGHANYRDKQQEQLYAASTILQLKYDYSMQITKSIQYINKILSRNKQTLMIIDPYNSFTNAIKMKGDILIVGLKKFFKKKFNYGEYKVLIIELQDDEWNVSLKQLAKNSKNERKILQYQKKRIMLPSQLNVIFIKRSFCSTLTMGKRQHTNNVVDTTIYSQSYPKIDNSNTPSTQPFSELMFAFRIFNFELSQSDYYLLIKMIIIQQLIKAKQHSSLQMIINKQQIIRKSFMGVLYFFCKKTNKFCLKNIQLIKQSIAMIQMWKITMIQTRGFQYQVFQEKHQKEQIKKIYRILSKVFKLVEMYFSRDNQYLNFDYFVSTLTRGAIYGIYNFGDQKYFILQYVISMIVYSLQSKNQFLSMFFMKIYSIEQNICTQMESDNLTFVMSQFDRLQGFVVQKIQKGTYNYFKHLPYQNKHLQNCYTKILAAQKASNNQLSHEQVNEIIQSFQNLSFFKKLVIKRILAPPIFEQQMIESINILSEIIIKNNDNFIKKFFRNGLLFCQCDIYFWKKNIKLKYKYEQTVLSDVDKVKSKKGQKVNALVIDDLESDQQQSSFVTSQKTNAAQRRDTLLKELISIEHQNSIFFSHLPLKQEFNKYFKSIPFLLFLELYCFVNIDNHNKDTLLEERKNRHSMARNSDISESIVKQIESSRQKSSQMNQSKNSPFRQSFHARVSQSPTLQPPNDNSYKIFTNKEIKRHYYSLISQKSTQQRSIAIIRFSNHIPFLLKNEKNESKILTYYYWKFLIWYQCKQKIVFESIKQKILKKSNQLADKLEHYQENKQILKAINILAPDKIRSQSQEILRIFKQYYAVLSTYISKQPTIDFFEGDTQRNVFTNQSTSYQKNIQVLLENIKQVSNILIGKASLDPQKVYNYFQKKVLYSLTDLNENLQKLSKHREQVNEQNTLTHLNIELIREPANIVALFSKPVYKIVLLSKNGTKTVGKQDNTKQQLTINDQSTKTIDEDLLLDRDHQINVKQKIKNNQNERQGSSKKALKQVSLLSKQSINGQKLSNRSKRQLKLILKDDRQKQMPFKLVKKLSDLKNDKSLQGEDSKRRKQVNNSMFKRSISRQIDSSELIKNEKRSSIQILPQKQPDTEDLFAKIFGKLLAAQQENTQQKPSSIANINTGRRRNKGNKGIPLHKIYIYNQYRILFQPIQKKELQKLNPSMMFRLNLFNSFDLRLYYQKQQTMTNKNITTFDSFSLGSKISGMQLASKNNVFNQFFGKNDKSTQNGIDGKKKIKHTVSNVMLKQQEIDDNVIMQEKSGASESVIKIDTNQDILNQGQDIRISNKSGRAKSEEKLLHKYSYEQKGPGGVYKSVKIQKFVYNIKEKKSFDHLKLKPSSSKKLQLVTSSVPSSIGVVFDSLISTDKNEDEQQQIMKQREKRLME